MKNGKDSRRRKAKKQEEKKIKSRCEGAQGSNRSLSSFNFGLSQFRERLGAKTESFGSLALTREVEVVRENGLFGPPPNDLLRVAAGTPKQSDLHGSNRALEILKAIEPTREAPCDGLDIGEKRNSQVRKKALYCTVLYCTV